MFENKDVIKILSIDGGGIRGIIPVTILAELEKRTGRRIHELFDYIAGTSTGGLLTLFLNKSNPQPAESLFNLYINQGKAIFPPRPVNKKNVGKIIESWVKNTYKDYMEGPKYTVDGLNAILMEQVGDAKMSDTINPCLITSYETENSQATFFTNYDDRYKNLLIREVARATSAAPTYFEPQKIAGKGTFIDGGMHSNNPSMCAYIEVIKQLKQANISPLGKKIVVVSLGTGDCLQSYEYEDMKKWSALNWIAGPLLAYFFGANSSTVEYQLQQLLPDNCYFRFQTKLPGALDPMDKADKENVLKLKDAAEKSIHTQWAQKLDELCNLLMEQVYKG